MSSRQHKTPTQIFSRLTHRTLRTSLGRHLSARLGRDPMPDRWVFILGCYNSGTTLLHTMLAEHPCIGALQYEGVSLTDQLPRPEEHGWPRMWCQCETAMEVQSPRGLAYSADRIKRQWSMSIPRGKNIIIEKSIANACRIPFLSEYFQPVTFIHIIRNGYAVAEGIRRKTKPKLSGNTDHRENYSIGLCAEQWRRADELITRHLTKQHHLQLYYEELCRDPVGEINRVTNLLELDPMQSNVSESQWHVHGVSGRIVNMNESSISRLSEDDIDAIRMVAGDRLDIHHYTTPRAQIAHGVSA